MVDATATRKTDTIPEIKPLDRYDFGKAKTRASVRWLLTKAFGSRDSVPADLRDSLTGDQYDQYDEGFSPAVVRPLVSCELYCHAYPSLLQRDLQTHTHANSDSSAPPTDHGSLLQLLHQRGLPVLHGQTLTPVTDVQLTSIPINMGAHLAVIDSLMVLAAMETMGRVKMAKEADQFGDGAIWENSLLFWINKLIQTLRERTEAEEGQKPQPCTAIQPAQPSIRYRKDKVQSKHTPTFPIISGVKDLSNGCAIAAAVHFYCPQILPLEDVCLKDTMTVADSLYNLQLIRDFCDSSLNRCCPLVLEDLLYAPSLLRVNIMCFLSDLLAVFEVQKPDFIKPLHTVDLTDASGLEDCTSPVSGSPFLFKQPLLPISSPGGGTEGRGWRANPISRPLSAVAFSIPFPLDSDVDVVMGNPLFRSVSTDSLTMGTNPASYTPPEDLSKLIGQAPLGELPTIEEALQVMHAGRPVQSEPRQRPEGAPAGFYLHSPNEDKARLSSSAPCHSGLMYRPIGGCLNGRRGGGAKKTVDSSRDDDSVLQDGSLDSDASEECSKSSASNPGTPANGPHGTRMTSFAERRKKLPESPGAFRGLGVDESLSPGMVSPLGAAEAQELGVRLEEKRRAIEAQKRRIEAIFTKHRQRLGKSAFLKLQREQGEGGARGGAREEAESLSLDERLTRMEEELKKEEEREMEESKEKKGVDEGTEADGLTGGAEGQDNPKGPPKLEKQVTFSVDTKTEPQKEPPLAEYNEAVSKLSSVLQCLQRDMQRLTEQQQRLMGSRDPLPVKLPPSRKNSAPSKAWVIPASPKSPKSQKSQKISATPPQLSREPSHEPPPSGSPSRATNPKSPRASALSSPRKSHGASRSPSRPQHRPCDLSFPPLTRALAPAHTVDTLPHLRRGSPSQCQVQTSSSFRLGGPQTPPENGPSAQHVQDSTSESDSSCDHTPLFTLELEAGPAAPPAGRCPVSVGGGSSSGAPSECSFDSDVLLSAPLRQDEGDTDQEPLDIFSSDSMSDQTETESRIGVGLFVKPRLSEEEMALKRALLLERQQRRTEEIKRKRENSRPCSTEDLRPSVTPPLSQSLPSTHTLPVPPQATPPATPLITPQATPQATPRSTPQATPRSTPQATPPGTPQRRGAFTKAEYARRHQLKIMADLERVLQQKPAQRSSQKQHTPSKGSPHSHSPRKEKVVAPCPPVCSRLLKPACTSDSASTLMSPSHLPNQNGEKDWENGSNASSPASIPEYTGPRLFKEPSLKSNKFIIHNALSHCCLAGKVNENQKNKIMEEMEKTSANHFLILLRDANCQFRAIYTLDNQSEELQRLCGVGPRVISCAAMEAIYKYSSDRKQFNVLPSRTVSMSVDAFTIPAHLWNTKKHGTPKKTANAK